jgi:cysteinyl-tRNA synthetase
MLRAAQHDIALNGDTAEAAIQKVIDVRTQARKNKDWAMSDRLRDALLGCGVALKDSKDGTTWSIAE